MQDIIYFLYNLNTNYTLVLTIIIEFIIGFATLAASDKDMKAKIISLVLATMIVFSFAFFIENLKINYRIIPQLSNTGIKLSIYEYIINDNQLFIDNCYDVDKNLMKGVDTNNNHYYVVDTDPKPGKLVSKESYVDVYLDYREFVTPINSEEASFTNYPNEYFNSITSYNANRFSLLVLESAINIRAKNFGYVQIGKISQDSDFLVTTRLINNATKDVIEEKKSLIGEEIEFNNIPDGTYYYEVICEGFSKKYPNDPFLLNKNNIENEDTLNWYVCLQKENEYYSNEFKVKLLKDGKPIVNESFDLGANSYFGNSLIAQSYSLLTDNEGYLSVQYYVNGKEHIEIANISIINNNSFFVFNEKYGTKEIFDVSGSTILIEF